MALSMRLRYNEQLRLNGEIVKIGPRRVDDLRVKSIKYEIEGRGLVERLDKDGNVVFSTDNRRS